MSDDIREWARSQGKTIGDTGPVPRAIREAYQAREQDNGDRLPPDVDPEPDTPSPEPVKESVPKPPTIADRARRSVAKRQRTAKGKGKSTGPRASIESILTGIYGAFAGGVGRVNPAVGMVMGIQAPVAGMLLEDTVKGTAVDRLLQPFAKNADRARTAKALLGPPMVVALMQTKPELAPMLVPQLRRMLADYVDLAGPKIVEIQKREAAFEEKYGAEVDGIINALIETINATNAAKAQRPTDEE